MNILVCNAGSTSLKFKLLRMPEEEVLIVEKHERVSNYEKGIQQFLESLPPEFMPDAVAFKTVLSKDHYGVHFIEKSSGRHEGVHGRGTGRFLVKTSYTLFLTSGMRNMG